MCDRVAVVLAAALLIGCSAGSAVQQPTEVTVASASAAAERPSAHSPFFVQALDLKNVTVDGSLQEWTGRATKPNSIAIVISNDRVYFGGAIEPGLQGGVFLTVGSRPPPLPDIGEWVTAGRTALPCTHETEFINGGYISTGTPMGPSAASVCRTLVEAHAELSQRHWIRFSKVYRFDRNGAQVLVKNGTYAPISNARGVWRTEGEGIAFEFSLPLTALPRVAKAPLQSIAVLVASASGPAAKPAELALGAPHLYDVSADYSEDNLPPPAVDEPAIDDPLPGAVELPHAISFEPHGDLRARMFQQMAESQYFVQTFFHTAAMSYQPGDPLHVESNHGDGMSVDQRETLLFDSKIKVGDLELGLVTAYVEAYAIYKQGKLIASFEPLSVTKAIFERDGEIHVLSYASSTSGIFGSQPPQWSATIVGTDGKARETRENIFEKAIAKADCEPAARQSVFSSGIPSASKNFDTFGFKGSCATPSGKRIGFELTWKWNAPKKTYAGSFRRIAAPLEK